MERGGSSAGPESLVLIDYHIITGACQFLKCWVLDEAVQGKGVSELLSYKGWSWSESLQWRWRGLPHLVRTIGSRPQKASAGSDFGKRKESVSTLDIGKALVRSGLSQLTTCASRLLS